MTPPAPVAPKPASSVAGPPPSGSQVAARADVVPAGLPPAPAAPAAAAPSAPSWGTRVNQWADQAKGQVSGWADKAQQAWDQAPAWKNTALMAAGVGGAGLLAGRMMSGDQRKNASAEVLRQGMPELARRLPSAQLHPAVPYAPAQTVPITEIAERAAPGRLGKAALAATALAGLALAGRAVAKRHEEPAAGLPPLQMTAEEGLKVSSAEQLEKSIAKLQALEDNPPEPAQLKRYALVGGAISPIASAVGDLIEGKSLVPRLETGQRDWGGGVRRLASKAVTGAMTTGVIPIIRHQLDRRAQIADLKAQLSEHLPEVKAATALIPSGTSPAQRLASSRRIGQPRMTNLEGPSIAQVSRTMGPVMPGASKGGV